jgi:hypothetical protein
MRIPFTIILTIFICLKLSAQTGKGAMLPGKDDIAGWMPAGEMKVFKSEALRNLAKDEAEFIMEYGFDNAIEQKYYNYGNKLITVDVFTMKNSFGSCGLFMRYSKKQKVSQKYGNSTYVKTGEYGFWKHLYFVKLSSASAGDTINEGFMMISAFIDSKIRSKGVIPEILGFSKDKPGNVTIFRGPLVLSEIYYFGPNNIFFMQEGIAIENGRTKEIILKYPDNNEAVRRFTEVSGILSRMSNFSDFAMHDNFSFSMKDRDRKTLVFSVQENCLNIMIR